MKQPLIYIIDSSQSYRKIIEGCLHALDYKRIRLFENGESCYSLVGSPADIIILDYNLGENCWNGIDFMIEYKRVNPDTDFIFISSTTNVDVAVKSIRHGASDYILKSKIGITRLAKQVEKATLLLVSKRQKTIQGNLLFISMLISFGAGFAGSIIYYI